MTKDVLDTKHDAFYELLRHIWKDVNQFVSTDLYPTPEGYKALARRIIYPNETPRSEISPLGEATPDSQ